MPNDPDFIATTVGAIRDLADLLEDWDGYGADPIDPILIEEAIRFVHRYPASCKSGPQVVPMTRGRLQFEWTVDGRELEVEFGEPGRSLIYYLASSGDEYSSEGFINIDDVRSVGRLFDWLYQGARL